MGLLYCGMDEAGYGPMLGPLCVGMSAFRVRDWQPEMGAPDVWSMLASNVCRTAKDAKAGRLAIADSKALKGPNTLKTRHPLRHLERGVIAFAGSMGRDIADDDGLGEIAGAALESCPWQGGDPVALPLDWSDGERAIAVNTLVRSMTRAGIETVDLRCRAMGVGEFNRVVERSGSKGAATEVALVEHMTRIREQSAADDHVRVVCDRQSGRMDYRDLLRRVWGSGVIELERSNRVSRYSVGERVGVQFVPEAEGAHFPVALASMLAKLMRELAMIRFNRYWSARVPELKPTAGYVQDARRWLTDAADAVSPEDRRAMVRIA